MNLNQFKTMEFIFRERYPYPGQRFTAFLKTLLIMRLTLFFIIASILNAHSGGFAQTVSLHLKHSTLPVAFSSIKQQTGYRFLYKESALKNTLPVNANISNATLKTALDILFEGQPLDYQIYEGTILVKEKNRSLVVQNVFDPEMPAKVQELPDRRISGRVTTEGKPLAGASVVAKGKKIGTTTNDNGEYALNVPVDTRRLIFSMVGYTSKEVEIGQGDIVNVELPLVESGLEEVVVTAMGITREKRALGYAAQSINSEELNVNQQSNLVNAMQGKFSGVTITGTGGGPGQGSRIVVRGINSLDPSRSSQPLFIVDGVEIDNSTATVGGGDSRGMSNRASDINPEDVESVTVLKGGAATALYGIRAANGAVIITTKSAKVDKLSIQYSGSYGIEQVNKSPKVETKFTQGYEGEYDSTSFWPSWGPTVEEARKTDKTHPAKLFDNYKRAYRNGNVFRQYISVSGGSETLQLGGDFAYNKQNGVIPFSDFTSYNTRVFGGVKMSEKFRAGFSLNYINNGGSRVNADLYGEELAYWSPRWDVTDYINPDGTQKTYGPDTDNPVYALATNRFFDNVNRTISSVNFQYKPFNWLNFTYRFGNDIYTDNRDYHAPGPIGIVNEKVNESNGFGFVNETFLKNRVITSTLIANISHTFNNQISFNLNLGHDLTDKKYKRVSTFGDTLVVNDLFLLQNAKKVTGDNYLEDYRNYGFFADMTIGYKNAIFLNLTGRQDNTSTLNPKNRTYYYPSASLSWVFTDFFDLSNQQSWLSYGKLKTSFATVAKDGTPYSILSGFGLGDKIGTLIPFTRNDQYGNYNLRPEFTNTIEYGFEMRFFKNRLGIDFTRYSALSKDLIVPVPISASTGYTSTYLNAGEISNKGIEVTLNATPIRNKDFDWNFSVNFSRNKSRVEKINEDLSVGEIYIADQFGYVRSNATMKLVPEYPQGAIFGRSYKRYYGNDTDDGITLARDKPLLIGANGFPIIDTKQRYLGKSEPDFIINTFQTVRYKDFSLSVLLDWRKGIMKYNQLANFMGSFGIAKFTENRTETRIFEGFLEDGTPNAKPVFMGQGLGPDGVDYEAGYYRNYYRASTENFVENASWLKLRSIVLSYSFTKSIFARTHFFKKLAFSVIGNNLWINTKFTGFDPESSSFSAGSNAAEGFSGFTYPGVRTISFSINAQF